MENQEMQMVEEAEKPKRSRGNLALLIVGILLLAVSLITAGFGFMFTYSVVLQIQGGIEGLTLIFVLPISIGVYIASGIAELIALILLAINSRKDKSVLAKVFLGIAIAAIFIIVGSFIFLMLSLGKAS